MSFWRRRNQGQGGNQNNSGGGAGSTGSSFGGNSFGGRNPFSGVRNMFGGRRNQGGNNPSTSSANSGLAYPPPTSQPQPIRGGGGRAGPRPGSAGGRGGGGGYAPQYNYQGPGTQPHGQYSQGMWSGSRPGEDYNAVYRQNQGGRAPPPRQPTTLPPPTADERRRAARYDQYNRPDGYWQMAQQQRPHESQYRPQGNRPYGVRVPLQDDPLFRPPSGGSTGSAGSRRSGRGRGY